ncbi:MAG: peroxiredoxin-like family protein [Sphingobacterium sp.]|uniref:peroxiredoxin-like family protein n=1 Tax=Sphingobacterium sp. JB170 TaxID=1434842 RepID=UPI00097EA51F|nr:peroxiredoxin-like family protein [Sphingobacterium sp. JB170]SJN47212.1 Peroxiredoxin [Sphingobacterium sp. JB170]
MNKKLFITLGIILCSIHMVSSQTNQERQEYPLKAENVSPLLIGEKIPALTLTDAMGEMIQLGKLFSEKPTIFVIYRGGWCPYCNLQLSGLQEIEKDLTMLGYQIIAVSTDKPENLKASSDKGELGYTLLSDADLSLAKAMGLAFKAPEAYHKFLPETTGGKNKDMLLPVPSVFILNKAGEIRFEYIEPNFKERVSPDLLKVVAGALYKTL